MLESIQVPLKIPEITPKTNPKRMAIHIEETANKKVLGNVSEMIDFTFFP